MTGMVQTTTFPHLNDPSERLEKDFSHSERTMNNLSAVLCKERQRREFRAAEGHGEKMTNKGMFFQCSIGRPNCLEKGWSRAVSLMQKGGGGARAWNEWRGT